MIRHRVAPTLVIVALLLTLRASAAGPVFPDVSQEHWAHTDIQRAADYGLMQGLQDGTFGPETRLDRASFITILCRMFSWNTDTLTPLPYSDVDPSAWYYGAVAAAHTHGALEDGSAFYPSAYISREEMAVMLVRALGYNVLAQDLAAKGSGFPDVTRNQGHIALASAIGMTNGIQQGDKLVFQPEAFATRGQAAAMLSRVYERYTSKIDWLHGFYAFASYPQLAYTAQMDGVSVGWARLSWDAARGPWVNTTSAEQNEWTIPQGAAEATAYFQQNGTTQNLNVFADCGKRIELADGTKTGVVQQITATAEARAAAVSALTTAAGDYAGLTIDFEGLKGDQLKADFVTFMGALRAALPQDKTLFVCVQPDTWYTGFDYRGLGEVCDKVILMAHDYQWTSVDDSYLGAVMGGPKTSSPVTPFPDIYEALSDITDTVIGVQDRSKIALAVSFGSAGFKIDGEGKLLEASIYHPAQDTIAMRLAQPDSIVTYDPHSRNPILTYNSEEGDRYMLWYEDARSVADKLDLARMFGITGVSLWRLGNIPSYPGADLHYDVWGAIQTQR